MFLSSRPEELSHLDILRIRKIQFQTHDFTFLSILNGPVLSIENINSLAGYPARQDVKALSHRDGAALDFALGDDCILVIGLLKDLDQ